MSPLVIAGGALLVASVVMAYLGWRSSRRVGAITATPTSSCSAVNAGLENPGTVVEVVGRAEPGEGGALVAPFTKQRCVWHRSVVTVRYWSEHDVRTSDGRTRRKRTQQNREVYDESSGEPFLLTDRTGSVAVDPSGAKVDKPAQVRNRFEYKSRSLLNDLGLGRLIPPNTIGWRREEWVIVPGERLYVLGAAVAGDRPGEATLAKPRSGHRELLISTRSERDLLRAGRWRTRLLYLGTVLAGLGGVAALVASVVTAR